MAPLTSTKLLVGLNNLEYSHIGYSYAELLFFFFLELESSINFHYKEKSAYDIQLKM